MTGVLAPVVLASGLLAGAPAHADATARALPGAASLVSPAAAHVVASSAATARSTTDRRAKRKAARLLDRVNRARSQPRTCGAAARPAAPPLRRDGALTRAARRHARDMARHSYVDHTGRSGSTPTSRARAAGYRGQVGENVAAGQSRPAQVIRAWLASPAHCANLMSRQYRDLGVGYGYAAGSRYGTYWVLDLGRR